MINHESLLILAFSLQPFQLFFIQEIQEHFNTEAVPGYFQVFLLSKISSHTQLTIRIRFSSMLITMTKEVCCCIYKLLREQPGVICQAPITYFEMVS